MIYLVMKTDVSGDVNPLCYFHKETDAQKYISERETKGKGLLKKYITFAKGLPYPVTVADANRQLDERYQIGTEFETEFREEFKEWPLVDADAFVGLKVVQMLSDPLFESSLWYTPINEGKL